MTNQTQSKSFILHKDSLSVLNKLTDEQAGKLFKSIFAYQVQNILPNDELVSIIFEPFLNQFKRDAENYKKTCEARKIAGSKGGKQKVANASKSKQKVANLADSDNKNKNESKNKSENKNKNDLPIFINKNLFDSFVQMRNKIKKPLTDYAKELLIKDLTKFEASRTGNANIALENSIKNSWQGVFEPKNNYNRNYSQPLQPNSISSSFDEKKNFYLENRNRIHPNLNEINDILNKIDNNQSKTQIIAYKAKTAFFVSNNANANLELDDKLEKYFDLIVVVDYKTKEKYEL